MSWSDHRLSALALLALLSGGLSACASAPRPHWAVDPVHQVRNAPVPVPRPDFKPRVPPRYAEMRPEAKPRTLKAAALRPQARPAVAGKVAVVRGDTVYGLARRHGVPVSDLVAVNDLTPPYILSVGDRLALPAPRLYRVRRGDTAYSVAARYDVKMADLARLNRLEPPFLLRVGQRLKVPSGPGAEMEVAARGAFTLPPVPPRTRSGFDWPAAGVIVSRFGPKEGGLRNDGINIAAPKGAPVRAAEAGVVAYAGDGLKGFGRLVLIRHSGGYVTAYGHNHELSVARGDRVRRGDLIGRVGATGAVSRPQLHFEIRKRGAAIDPLKLLPTVQARAR